VLRQQLTSVARRRPYLPWLLACMVLLVIGTVLLGSALNTGPHAPRPHSSDAQAPLGPTNSSPSSRPQTGVRHQTPARAARSLARPDQTTSLPASTPTSLVVPAIGISSRISQLGLKTDGTIEVPPLTRHSPVGWYRLSPTPGETGTSVMLGHIDSAAYGPAVFFRLAALRPGDPIDVHRSDGITAVFRVDRVAEYPKNTFPTQLVYGTTNYPSLRLITCGGSFNRSAHSYRDNIVVYATLTITHP
jgi:Sortase domain